MLYLRRKQQDDNWNKYGKPNRFKEPNTHIIQASDLSQSLIIPLRYEVGLLIGRWLVVPAADIIIHLQVWFCVLVWTEEGCFMIKNYLLYILSIESRSYGVFPRRSHLKNRVFLIKTEQSTLEILQWTYHKYWKVVFYIIKECAWNKAPGFACGMARLVSNQSKPTILTSTMVRNCQFLKLYVSSPTKDQTNM